MCKQSLHRRRRRMKMTTKNMLRKRTKNKWSSNHSRRKKMKTTCEGNVVYFCVFCFWYVFCFCGLRHCYGDGELRHCYGDATLVVDVNIVWSLVCCVVHRHYQNIVVTFVPFDFVMLNVMMPNVGVLKWRAENVSAVGFEKKSANANVYVRKHDAAI